MFYLNYEFAMTEDLKEFNKLMSAELRRRGETVSVAESVTAGLLQNAFSLMPLAENFFEGGITAYTLQQKMSLLGIDRDEAKMVNCVSRNIAEAMALNVAELFKTDWSVATTGYATAVPESGGELYAFFAVTYHGKIIYSGKIDAGEKLEASEAQKFYTAGVLDCLLTELTGLK